MTIQSAGVLAVIILLGATIGETGLLFAQTSQILIPPVAVGTSSANGPSVVPFVFSSPSSTSTETASASTMTSSAANEDEEEDEEVEDRAKREREEEEKDRRVESELRRERDQRAAAAAASAAKRVEATSTATSTGAGVVDSDPPSTPAPTLPQLVKAATGEAWGELFSNNVYAYDGFSPAATKALNRSAIVLALVGLLFISGLPGRARDAFAQYYLTRRMTRRIISNKTETQA